MTRRRAPRRTDGSRRARGDAGFTLVEMLVVIVVEAIIVGALGSALIVILRQSSSVDTSLDKSSDARFAAAYMVSDARNSSGPEISLTDVSSCADPNPPVSGTPVAVVRFDWDVPLSAGGTSAEIVDYVLVNHFLLRRHCVSGSLVSDDVIAQDVASAAAVCSPTADCSGTPASITVTITETADASGGSPFSYSLTATFRKEISDGSPLTPSAPTTLIALGTGGNCATGGTGLSLVSSSNMRVYGAAYVNTVNAACKAMSLTSNAVFQAGSTNILSGGTCIATTGSTCPTTSSYTPAIADPYAGLSAPSTSGMPSRSGCAGGVASPGNYASTLTVTGSGVTCQLASGVYYLQNGLTVSSSASLTAASGGVLIYLAGGTLSVGSSASVNVKAQSSGAYAGVAIWQAAADTNTMTYTSTGGLTVDGFVYAPGAQVTLSNTSASPSLDGLDAKVIWMTSSGKITIGNASTNPLQITGPAAPPSSWTAGQPYPSQTLTATGGDGNYVWTVTNLPTGMTFDPGTAVVSGTPTTPGVYSASVTLNDLLGDTPASGGYTLTINAAPNITTASLPSGQQTVAYSTTLASTGGTPTLTWTASPLPAGLSINSSTGVISGTPTATGTTTVGITLTDAAGATDTASIPLTIAAQPTITSVSLQNGGATQGKIEQGDKIVITYSAQMRVSSFCSTWSNDANSQSLSTDSNVTVTLNDGTSPTHDSISVSSTSCTFNLGTIDLGSSSYISGGSATFNGTSTSKSTITWTASTHTLTIVFGAKASGGTPATVSSSTPIYTASGSIKDSAGAVLGNSPYTLVAAKEF